MEFIDLKAQYQTLKTDIDSGIASVLTHGQFIRGKEVEELELALAEFTGRKHCVTCGNGTDALQIVFMAYGIQKGDALFCPDITFVASVEPGVMLGATPVFCDILPDTYNISSESLETQIKAVLAEGKLNPKAVIAIDFLGNPAEYDAMTAICKKYGLLLIEDAAQSFGALYHGKRCGALGDIATTSFFPAKPLGCYGDGGAIFTDDDEIADVCRSICVHGKGPGGKYANIRVGMNSRLDTLQAAILLPKLRALREYEIEKRQEVAERYNKAFQNEFVTPFVERDCVSVYAQYAILVKNSDIRSKIIQSLKEQDIPNMVYYPTPQHLLPVFLHLNAYGEPFANAMDYCARTLSLPMHPYLTEEMQDAVISAVLEGNCG